MRPHDTVRPQPAPELPAGATPSGLVDPFEVTLSIAPDAPAAARAAVTAWMAGHVSEAMLADAQLLVAELVANSVRHADAAVDAFVRVRAWLGADVLCVEVEDRGTSGSIVRRAPDLQHGGGFGLNVVDALSARWGVNRDGCTRVWAELPVPVSGGDLVTSGEPIMHFETNGRIEARHDAVVAAQRRADNARRRAVAARDAAAQATTEYARRAHHRVAELHAQLAVSHDDFARTLRFDGGDPPRR
jgi:anti-sigma regulatory factor (Ser/Thr protein kinase)